MRDILKTLICVFVFLLLFISPLKAEIKSVQLFVKGLSCPFCALGLEKQLEKAAAVKKADVHLKPGRVDLTLNLGRPLELRIIQRAVKEAGFTLEDIQVEINGLIEEDRDGALVLVSTGDNERFFLFDENHKENETREFLSASVKDQLLSAKQAEKMVVINGVIHEHANLPSGLMIQQIKVE